MKRIFLTISILLLLNLASCKIKRIDFSKKSKDDIIRILDGNSVKCYNEIWDLKPLFKKFTKVGNQYVEHSDKFKSIRSILADLIQKSESMRYECGVELSAVTYGEKKPDVKYCIQNVEDMMKFTKSISGKPPLHKTIRTLN